ncbi:MAG: hypothetical protein JRK26_11285 [Deltaproteobacteria bacterium]|nr:hypothetical protein [Deltaproteobacteria bacterium]
MGEIAYKKDTCGSFLENDPGYNLNLSRKAEALPKMIAKMPLGHMGMLCTMGLVWFSLLAFPNAPCAALDSSWRGVLTYAYSQGLQYGKDVIFTYGPLSVFLVGQEVFFGYFWGPWAWGAWFYGSFTLLFFLLIRPLATWLKVLSVCLMLLFGTVIIDAQYFFFLCATVLYVISHFDRQRERGRFDGAILGVLGATFGFILLTKFSYLVLGAFLAFTLGLDLLCRKSLTYLAWFFIPMMAVLVGGYAGSGQSWDALPGFLRGSWEIATGYGKAMMLFENKKMFVCGAALILVNALFALHYYRANGGFLMASPFLLAHLVSVFICWKAGFTRADSHVIIFFAFNIFLGPLVVYMGSLGYTDMRFSIAVCLMLVVLGVAGLSMNRATDDWRHWFQKVFGRIRTNILVCMNLDAQVNRLVKAYEQKREELSLPGVMETVGGEILDVFGYEQNYAILNGFQFVPRPVFHSYSAYSPRLLEKNLNFYIEKTPKWVLFKLQTIDNRFPTLDDSLVLKRLLYDYKPVLEEKDFTLLQVQPFGADQNTGSQLVYETAVGFGESIPITGMGKHPLWAEIVIERSLLGKLVNFLYKCPEIEIEVGLGLGTYRRYRFIPEMGKAGFWLHPLLEDRDDVMDLLGGKVRKAIHSFRFIRRRWGWSSFYGETVLVRLYQLPWPEPGTGLVVAQGKPRPGYSFYPIPQPPGAEGTEWPAGPSTASAH